MTNPKIVVEVLSPSTAEYDRGESWRTDMVPIDVVGCTRGFDDVYDAARDA